MEGKKVEIQLHTPILIPASEEEAARPHLEAVIKVTGIIAQFSTAGMLVEVEELVSEKNHLISCPHPRIFLPLHKIDHFFIPA